MKDVADHHLVCRKGTWYYRRRMPKHAVAAIGRSIVQHTLGTKDSKQAKRLREIEDVKWSALFDATEAGSSLRARPEKG